MNVTQPPLFGDPEPEPAAPRKRAATWVALHRGVNHGTCDRCRSRLHQLGIARGPRPQRARYARHDPDGTTTLLCRECAAELRAAEKEARR